MWKKKEEKKEEERKARNQSKTSEPSPSRSPFQCTLATLSWDK